MQILVTGGAGFIGSHTCKALAEAGHRPIVLDNLSTGHRANIRYGPLIEADIRDEAALDAAFGAHAIDAVIHFAASAYVGESVRDPLGYYSNNVHGTLSLLRAMARAHVSRLVFSSSCATYGVPDALPIGEDAPQRPINPYGETKLVGEAMIRAQVATGMLTAVALRYFNAAGADPDGELGEQHDPETHLLPLALRAARDPDLPLTIFGTDYPTPDGTCIRDYLHVTDLARAHVMALDPRKGATGFEVFNLGTGTGTSVREIVSAVEAHTGRAVATRIAERRPGDPPALVADPGRANAVLDWRPVHSNLDTIVETAWRWFSQPGR